MPVRMKRTAIIRRNQISKTLILLYTLPMPETVYASSHAKIITGIPVASAKTTGRYRPDALATVIGTRMPK